MAKTIADAIDDSKQQLTKRYRRETMPAMAKKYPLTSSVEILRRLVDQAGGRRKNSKERSNSHRYDPERAQRFRGENKLRLQK